MKRRVFLAGGLALAGLARRAWGQLANPAAPVRYAPLTRPVTIPLEAVAEPWRPVSFVAEGSQQGRRILISGVLFRRASAAEDLSALCVTCPHEQCQVDLVTDTERLARMHPQTTHPLFECGCHFSVFDAARDGARISGESPRGLYRFRIREIRNGVVEIHEVEEAALSDV